MEYDILCIDDDYISRLIYQRVLKASKHTLNVTIQESGEHALCYLKDKISSSSPLPSLILLDLNMPDMNGWQFLTAFQELTKDIHVRTTIIIVSSAIDTREIEKSLTTEGVQSYIMKPFTFEHVQIIDSALLNNNQSPATPVCMENIKNLPPFPL